MGVYTLKRPKIGKLEKWKVGVYTMASTRTTTRTIRISNEAAEYFKEKALNRAVESLYGLLTGGTLSFDGDELKVGCVHQNSEKSSSGTPENDKRVCTPDKDYESICEMANLMRVEPGVIIEQIKELLESGELYISHGRLVNPRYEEFESLCERKKWDADKIIDKVVREYGG